MSFFTIVLLIGILSVITFDTIGSLTSRRFGFNYSYLTVGSLLIYAIVGFFASKYNGLGFAPLASGIIGLVDSTLGWYISWIIGPGRPPLEIDSNYIIKAISLVIILSTVTGFIGGLLANSF